MEESRKDLFGQFLTRLREERGITREDLCNKICTKERLIKIEKGIQYPDKLLQDRLVERLGVSVDGFERYLYFDEYEKCCRRAAIVDSLLVEEVEQAQRELEEYETSMNKHDVLSRQFCLAMRAQIAIDRRESPEFICDILEQAIRLTVPRWKKEAFSGRVLSVQEWNLILEFGRYCENQEKVQFYRQIKESVEQSRFDSFNRAKIHTKVIYYLCREMAAHMRTLEPGEKRTRNEEILTLCNQGIELLQKGMDCWRLYGFLCIKEYVLKNILGCLDNEKKYRTSLYANQLRSELTAIGNQRRALDFFFKIYGKGEQSASFCYLYLEYGCMCVEDVIATRVEMMGYSTKEFCRSICSADTFRRMKQKKFRTHRVILQTMLARLKLPAEFMHYEIISDRFEAKELNQQFTMAYACCNYEMTVSTLKQMNELISKSNILNRQCLLQKKNFMDWEMGHISTQTYQNTLIRLLEMTVNIQNADKWDRIYLTKEEADCIGNLLLSLEAHSAWRRLFLAILRKLCCQYEQDKTVGFFVSQYESYMNIISGMLGDDGQYDLSNELADKCLRTCAKYKQVKEFQRGLYNRLWNECEKLRKGLPADEVIDWRAGLNHCYVICQMFHNNAQALFFKQKMEEWEKAGDL